MIILENWKNLQKFCSAWRRAVGKASQIVLDLDKEKCLPAEKKMLEKTGLFYYSKRDDVNGNFSKYFLKNVGCYENEIVWGQNVGLKIKWFYQEFLYDKPSSYWCVKVSR